MNVPVVSKEVWEGLYGAARVFNDTECWDWISEEDLFGVMNPENKEIGYCCVLGGLGEVFGLVLYLGTEGFNQYKALLSGELGVDGEAATFDQNCLKASFEDRKELSKPDLNVIKGLGLQFRGRNAWPQFRSFRPGYFPWYLTESEAKFLALALRQATEVVLRVRDDPKILSASTENHYLVRVPVQSGARWEWTDQWLEPTPAAKTQSHTEPPDELRLRRIRQTVPRTREIWQADSFSTPIAIEEDGRPSYPRTLLCADRESRFILGMCVASLSGWKSELADKFLEWIESNGFLPAELQVKNKDVYETLEPLTIPLKIKLRQVKNLRAVNEAKSSLLGFLSRRRI